MNARSPLRTVFKCLIIMILGWGLRLSAFDAKVVQVFSGDSLSVELEDKKRLRIHLAGMDAPEMPKGTLSGQPFAVQAMKELSKAALGSIVEVLIYQPHEHEGYYAILFSKKGICLNTYMVESGLAVLTPMKDLYYAGLLEDSYELARQNRWNIWSLSKQETPFEYRQRTKKQHLD
jgi:endonuclease YncB( thermonuclease family)